MSTDETKTKTKKSDPEPNRLLWVKIPVKHSKKLAETAESIGISRADFMRLILINFINNEQNTFTISTQNK